MIIWHAKRKSVIKKWEKIGNRIAILAEPVIVADK